MFSSWPLQLRAVLAGVTGLVVSLAFGQWLLGVLRRRRVLEDVSKPDAQKLDQLHAAKKNTPTMGGLMILAGGLAAVLLWADLRNVYVVLGLAVAVGLAGVGFLDDALKLHYKRTRRGPRGLSKRRKLLLQSALGLLVGFFLWRSLNGSCPAATRLYAPFFGGGLDLGPWHIPWTAVVLVAASNSVNITDGLDGLAAGCALITTVALMPLAAAAGSLAWSRAWSVPYVPAAGELCVFLAATLGAVLGFLWYNCHPADIFMGDTGSLPLGGLIGFFAVAIRQEILLLLIGAVFVGDMASVLLQVLAYKTTGRRIFRIAPYHHALEYRGWPESKITVRLWAVAAVMAACGLAALAVR